jgi:GTP-binding protein HflX
MPYLGFELKPFGLILLSKSISHDIFHLSMDEVVKKALLIGIQLPKVSDDEIRSSLMELSRLVETLGYEVIGQTSQKRSSEKSATVLGDGKLKEIAQWTGGTGQVGPLVVKKKHKAALRFAKNQTAEEDSSAKDDSEQNSEEKPKADILIVDCELSPSQLRNLESASGVPVLDRTGVIIEIFSRHARTRAARLQVEIARLTYMAPRIRETGAHEDRGGGGVGGKGAGETSHELDKRRIRDRIKELKEELDSIADEHDLRRSRREQEITVALVGYTNAGKSSLMRALTGSEVYIADKLFATLDTTVRILHPETKPRILISDTVGFIKKLPHDLVASFKSTLDEAKHASLLLFVVDASDPDFRSQLAVTKQVLSEVGAANVDSRLVLNKQDRLSAKEKSALALEFPGSLFVSAVDPTSVQELREFLIQHFENALVEEDLFIPYDVQGAVGDIRTRLKVLSEDYDHRGLKLRVLGKKDEIQRLRGKHGI